MPPAIKVRCNLFVQCTCLVVVDVALGGNEYDLKRKADKLEKKLETI